MDDPEVERAVQLELLGSAIDLDDLDDQLTALHALCDAELALGAPARARGWLAEAERLLSDGRGGVQIRARYAEARARVEAAGPGPVEAVEMPAPLPPMTEAELATLRADVERRRAEFEVRRAQVEAEIAANRAKVEAIEARQAPAPPRDPSAELAENSSLILGQPLAALPAHFAYARDDGPPVPGHVRVVSMTERERAASLRTGIILVTLLITLAMFLWVTWGAAAKGDGLNTAIGVGVSVLNAVWAGFVYARIRASRADGRAREAGRYRVGVYFDGDAMLWRWRHAFTLLPRAKVRRGHITYERNSELRMDVPRLTIDYEDSEGEQAWRPDDLLGVSPGEMVELIERWRAGKRLGA